VAEAVLLSITPSYIAELRERDPKQADRLQRIKTDKIDRSLAAILTVNTIAHTVGAIGAGSQGHRGLRRRLVRRLLGGDDAADPVPVGDRAQDHRCGALAPADRLHRAYVNLLILLMYPLILVSEKLTQLISRGQKVHVFSREEFIAMTDIGQKSGRSTSARARSSATCSASRR
jgi:hypothetical protein